MQVQAYLNFDGRCEEALTFYHEALGAEVTQLMRFGDSPEQAPPGAVPPGTEKKVMHAALKVGDTTLMASDCHNQGQPTYQGFSLALNVPTAADADRVFAALSDGGQVTMPLGQTFWSPRFGMVADRFGLTWMVSAAA